MGSLNRVQLIGRLGADPEIRYTQSGTAVANFTMATSEKWKKEGEDHEKTEWSRIVAWGRLAEVCGEYLHKGDQAYVEGKLQTRSWEDKDGVKRYTTEIVILNLVMLGSGKGKSGESGGGRPPDIDDEEIPF